MTNHDVEVVSVQDPNRDLDQQSSPTSLLRQPNLVCMADVLPKTIDWLWPNPIPVGRLSLLVGRPGAGKSFLTCDLFCTNFQG